MTDARHPLGPHAPELRRSPPWLMEEMIAIEPELGGQICDLPAVAQLAGILRTAVDRSEPIAVVGCGTSEHAAMAVAALLRDASPSDSGHGPRIEARQAFEAALDPWGAGVCLTISHGGASVATNQALEAARSAGATTALITAVERSAATELADHVLVTPLEDRSWCHTVGYLSPVIAGGVVAAAMFWRRLSGATVRAFLDQALTAAGALDRLALGLDGVTHLVIAGSGIDLIAARELALKVEEGARLPAVARNLETVLHGHLAACDDRTGLVLILTEQHEQARRVQRAASLLGAARRIGIRTMGVLGAGPATELEPQLTSAGRMLLPGSTALSPQLTSLLSSGVALQRLTLALAHARDLNPDLIRREQPAYREAAAIAESKSRV